MNLLQEKKLSKIYYKPENLWHGGVAIDKLVTISGMNETKVKGWIYKQAIWQIYLPAPKYIPRHAMGGEELRANDTHQADLLFLPYDTINGVVYKYALTVIDVGSRYKEAEPLRTKYSSEVAKAFETIYTRSSLIYPKKLNIDSGGEFKGEVKKLFTNHNVELIVGEPGNHRAQGIVERFNKTLAEKLFPAQYMQEMIREGRSSEWVENLPSIIKVLNETETRLIKQKPIDAITNSKPIHQSPSLPANRPQGFDEKIIEGGVRYLYRPGEQEGGERRRATDPIWSMKIYEIKHKIINNNQPILYYLKPLQGEDGPKRSFVREELLKVPWNTELPPNI